TRTLPVAIEADESAQTVRDVFRLVSERAVDVVNLKITNLGGIRRFLQAVHICEAGEVGCRVGAAFGPALLQSMSLQAACVIRGLPYAGALSERRRRGDAPVTPLPARAGSLALPDGPGCGVSYRDLASSIWNAGTCRPSTSVKPYSRARSATRCTAPLLART